MFVTKRKYLELEKKYKDLEERYSTIFVSQETKNKEIEKLKEELEKFNKENKNLQDKLHQKERSEFKLKIISEETSRNLDVLKREIELLNNNNIKYKNEINAFKKQLKKTDKIKKIKVSSFKPVDRSSDNFETQISVKENLKPNINSHFNENLNRFTDIKNLNKKQWNEILEFGAKHKFFNNRDKQKLNNIIVRLKIREPLRPAQLEEGNELFKLAIKNGFNSSIAVQLSIPEKIEENKQDLDNDKDNIEIQDDELLEKVKTFKYDEWTQMFEWAKKKKKLKSKDLSLLNVLAIRSNDRGLGQKEVLLGLELYFILMSEGFELVKKNDVDDFLMQFAEEDIDEISVKNEKEEIPDVLKNILF